MLLTEEEEENVRKILEAPCSFKPPADFNFRPQSWKKWRRRFARYIVALEDQYPIELEEAELVHVLMYLLGDPVYVGETFRVLERMGWNEDTDLKETVGLLGAHFRKAAINTIYLRVNFHRRMQMPGESLIEFVKAVRFLAAPCKFDQQYETIMRDKVVIGIHSEEARQKMFSYDDLLTYEMALRIAFNHELRTGRKHG